MKGYRMDGLGYRYLDDEIKVYRKSPSMMDWPEEYRSLDILSRKICPMCRGDDPILGGRQDVVHQVAPWTNVFCQAAPLASLMRDLYRSQEPRGDDHEYALLRLRGTRKEI